VKLEGGKAEFREEGLDAEKGRKSQQVEQISGRPQIWGAGGREKIEKGGGKSVENEGIAIGKKNLGGGGGGGGRKPKRKKKDSDRGLFERI